MHMLGLPALLSATCRRYGGVRDLGCISAAARARSAITRVWIRCSVPRGIQAGP